MDGVDFNIAIDMETFDALCQPLLDRLETTLNLAVNDFKDLFTFFIQASTRMLMITVNRRDSLLNSAKLGSH